MKTVFPVVLSAAFLSIVPVPSHAQLDITSQLGEIVQKSTNELAVQINLSGRQRMLTQKMSKEALLIALEVEPEKNRRNLERTMALFERTLVGLISGDAGLKLAKAPNARIAAQLGVVMDLWKKFRPLVKRVAAGHADRATLERIARDNLPLLAEMNRAVKMFEKAAGADTAELAVVINLSGRQRMLTQKMTKEYLLAALDIDRTVNRRNLMKTAALFDRTLRGLLDGDDAQDIPPTTDPSIRAQLGKVVKLWQGFRPLLGRPATRENLLSVAHANLPLLAEMNRAVKMYEESW